MKIKRTQIAPCADFPEGLVSEDFTFNADEINLEETPFNFVFDEEKSVLKVYKKPE